MNFQSSESFSRIKRLVGVGDIRVDRLLFHSQTMVEKGRRKVEAPSRAREPFPARLPTQGAERYPEKPECYPDTPERYPDGGGTLSRFLIAVVHNLIQLLR